MFTDLQAAAQMSVKAQDSTPWNLIINTANKAVDGMDSGNGNAHFTFTTSISGLGSNKIQRFCGRLREPAGNPTKPQKCTKISFFLLGEGFF